jgi:hypothetical protein
LGCGAQGAFGRRRFRSLTINQLIDNGEAIRIGIMRALNQPSRSGVQPQAQRAALGPAQAGEGPMTVWIYVDSSKQVGGRDHLKVFATERAANHWFEDNDPDGGGVRI